MAKTITLLVLSCFLICIGSFQEAKTQSKLPPDSCLGLIWKHEPAHGYRNPDSVLWDSCSRGINQDAQHRRDLWYAKKYFDVRLPFYCFKINNDTIKYFNINDIGTNYKWIKDEYVKIQNQFGDFIIEKYAIGVTDTTNPATSIYFVHFKNYNNIEEVNIYIHKSTIFFKNFGYTGRQMIQLGSEVKESYEKDNSVSLENRNGILSIDLRNYPNEVNTIEVYNLLGEKIKTVTATNGTKKIEIDMNGFIEQICFIRINNNVYKVLI